MNASIRTRILDLRSRCSDLKAIKEFASAISLQLEVIELLKEHAGTRQELATAHNYASVLYLHSALFRGAERHARLALSLSDDKTVKDLEARGCYNQVLAWILAAQKRFDEALPFAENAVRDYSAFHNPPDEYLARVSKETEQIRNRTWALPQY